ncbi:MAG: hypothetical protein ACOCX5_05380, partial [Chloroflexota bacterium]
EINLYRDAFYLVTVTYEDTIFTSQVKMPEPGSMDLELPVTVYEFTDDDSVIEIDLMLTRVSSYGDNLLFEQIVNFYNTSDYAYRDIQQVDQTRFESVRLALPHGATILNQAELMSRFVQTVTDGKLYLVDTLPVVPDSNHTVYIAYVLPFNGGQGPITVEFPIGYSLTNQLELMLQPGRFLITSDQLNSNGVQQFTSGTYDSYLGSPLSSGETLAYTIELSPEAAAIDATASQQTDDDKEESEDTQPFALLLLTSGIGLLTVSGGLWMLGRRVRNSSERS